MSKPPSLPPIDPRLLERAGFVKCSKKRCRVWLDPANLTGERCVKHGGKY